MTTTTRVPALGAEGWFTPDDPEPALLGMRCTTCGTYVFPKADFGCPNPACAGLAFDEVRLSRFGTVWSYTDARYQPPPPYVVPTEEHEPFCIAAVHLAEEGLVVMGQMVPGVTVDDLRVGLPVELVVDALFTEGDTEHVIWKWKPVTEGGAA
ncbi:MAG: OB-fold domain-containing protein [Acidimicrobiales bacterium]